MDQALYTFDRRGMTELVRLVRKLQRRIEHLESQPHQPKARDRENYLFRLTGSISGTRPNRKATAERIELQQGQIFVLQANIEVWDDLHGDLEGTSGASGTYFWQGGRPVIHTLHC